MPNALTITVYGRDRGAIALLNRVGAQVRATKAEAVGLQEVQAGLRRASRTALAGAMALGGGLLYVGRQSAQFEQELRNVNTMARLDASGFRKLGDDVLNIARNKLIADMPVDLAQGLYEIESAGFKGRNALQVLETAAIGAAAGVEDTAAAANSLVAILGAYGTRTGPAALKTMDQLITMVEIGVLRFRDLTGEMGGPAAVAAQLQLPFEEVAAAIALMTTKGFSVSESATAVERALTSFLAPSKALTKAAREAGYESATAALKAEGLAGAMRLVERAAGGDQAELMALFGNVRALRAALSVTGPSAAEYANFVDRIRNSTGAAGRMAEEVARGPLFQFRKALQELMTESTALGQETLLPIGTEFIQGLRESVAAFRELSPEERKHIVMMALAAAKTMLAVGALGMLSNSLLSIIQMGGQIKGVIGLLTKLRIERAGAAAAPTLAGQLAQIGHAPARRGAGRGGTPRNLAAQQSLADDMIREAQMLRGARNETAQAALADQMIAQQTTAQMESRSWRGAGGRAGLQAAERAAIRRELGEMGASMAGAPLDVAGWRSAFAARNAAATGGQALRAGNAARAASSVARLEQAAAGATRGLSGLRGMATSLPTLLSGGVRTAAAGAASGLASLGTSLTGLAASAGPIAIAGAALAGLGMEINYLGKRHGTLTSDFQAMGEAKRNKRQARTAEREASDQGFVTPDEFYKSRGYTQSQIDRGMVSLQDQRDMMKAMGTVATHRRATGVSTAAKEEKRGAAEQAARQTAWGLEYGKWAQAQNDAINARYANAPHSMMALMQERERARQGGQRPAAAGLPTDMKAFAEQLRGMGDSELAGVAAQQEKLTRGQLDLIGKTLGQRDFRPVPTGLPGQRGYEPAPLAIPVVSDSTATSYAGGSGGGRNSGGQFNAYVHVGTVNSLQALKALLDRTLDRELGLAPA